MAYDGLIENLRDKQMGSSVVWQQKFRKQWG